MFPTKPLAKSLRRARRPPSRQRRGLTLIELLISTSMMLMLAGVMGGLAVAVQTSADYSQGHALATQQARVALERITRSVRQAAATSSHPGFVVVASQVDGWRYPDTLIVWLPTGLPANPDGPPLVRELVFYSPHWEHPEQLLEITAPGDARPLPFDAPLEQSPWVEMIAAIKADSASRRVVLSNLLRVSPTVKVSGTTTTSTLRGAVRFERELRPSAAEWAACRAGDLAWNELSWAQGIVGSTTGLRQVWLRAELQLAPATAGTRQASGQLAVPYFGSASLLYELHKPEPSAP